MCIVFFVFCNKQTGTEYTVWWASVGSTTYKWKFIIVSCNFSHSIYNKERTKYTWCWANITNILISRLLVLRCGHIGNIINADLSLKCLQNSWRVREWSVMPRWTLRHVGFLFKRSQVSVKFSPLYYHTIFYIIKSISDSRDNKWTYKNLSKFRVLPNITKRPIGNIAHLKTSPSHKQTLQTYEYNAGLLKIVIKYLPPLPEKTFK